jgi:2'-5' RNA ligase
MNRHPVQPTIHNLYFGLQPNAVIGDDLVARALQYSRRWGLSGQPTPSERLHVSLNGLGARFRWPAHLVARLLEAGASVRMRPFVVAFDRIDSWRGRRRPLVLLGGEGVIGVSMLYEAIHNALTEVGIVRGPPPDFNPHLTLLRDRRESPAGFIAPVVWRVREFVLIDSLYGQGRHVVLGRWRLAG